MSKIKVLEIEEESKKKRDKVKKEGLILRIWLTDLKKKEALFIIAYSDTSTCNASKSSLLISQN